VVLALESNLCWKPFLEKFGNSLKLRMGIRIDAGMAITGSNYTASGGVFTSNADNATLQRLLILIQYGLI
jgi:hypothetical protein